MENFQKPPDDN